MAGVPCDGGALGTEASGICGLASAGNFEVRVLEVSGHGLVTSAYC